MPKSADSESKTKQGDGYTAERPPVESFDADDVPWTVLTRDELATAYWGFVAPALRAGGYDPQTHRPTHEWLSANGFRGLVYALREYHDRTFTEFWRDDLDLEDDADGYDWDITHEGTVDAFERFLQKRESRLDWDESTVRAHRYRLNRYAVAYDGEDLLSPVEPEGTTDETAAADACRDAFDALDAVVSRRTLKRIHRTVRDWYDWLEDRRLAALNPAVGIRYNWAGDDDGPENRALTPAQVRSLYHAATTTRARLLVVALCAWGLRTNEVATLHRDQLVLDGDSPHVAFDERKNGPGTVAILYGADVARARLTRLDGADWNGYLFPSDRSDAGHRSPGTVRRWFDDLADRAGVDDVHGEPPVPQMGRRFWYDRYSDTVEDLVSEHIAEIAAEQGSASASVVFEDYLSDERKRELRRQFMREKLAEAFENRE